MVENHDFEIVNTRRNSVKKSTSESEKIIGQKDSSVVIPEVLDKVAVSPMKQVHPLTQAAADNFSRILDIASQYADIVKIREMNRAQLQEMREKRKLLESEAVSYVKKRNADTNSFVAKAEITRLMLEDYYKFDGAEKISFDDFIKILEVLNL